MPRLIAVRVVSLPATASRMKNGAISCGARMSSPRSLCTSADVRSSAGSARRFSASSFISVVSCMPASNIAVIGSRPPSMSGSPAPRMTFVASSTVRNSLRGMPIMSQMTSSGNGCESASTRSTSPRSHMSSITSVQIVSTDSSTPCELPRRERARDDAALARVARVVHVDERPEELQRLRRQVGDRDRALSRAEVLGSAADLDELRVADDGVETLGQPRHRVVERRPAGTVPSRAARRSAPCGPRAASARTPGR